MSFKISTTVKRHLADTVTPVSAYLAVRQTFPGSVLLESGDYLPDQGCFSYLAFDELAQFKVVDETITERYPDGTEREAEIKNREQVLTAIKQFTQTFQITNPGEINGLSNGLFGYFSFDCVKYFDELNLSSPSDPERAIPEISLRLFRYVVAINHYRNELFLIENNVNGAPACNFSADQVLALIHSRVDPSGSFSRSGAEQESLSDAQVCNLITRCQSHIQRGDVFQIVPSRRFSHNFSGDDFLVYRALRSINPSPFLFYFDFEDFRIFGSSPEAHLIVQNGEASIYPIAGTYHRTGDADRDRQSVVALSEDPKENSEHVMLVDLARNDLSKHCEGVRVAIYKEIKSYSHVIHITSKVTGTLTPTTSAVDLLIDTFPMGTLSGAPKYRALELIDQYEGSRRGPYAGAIGCLGFDGSANFAIIIRSFLSKNETLFYQVGAGIVADSIPEREVAEMNSKIGALRSALMMAEEISK